MDVPSPPNNDITALQSSIDTIKREENELVERLQGTYGESANISDHEEAECFHYCFCLRKPLHQFWIFAIHVSAGILNILDLALIKIVNRLYYQNI